MAQRWITLNPLEEIAPTIGACYVVYLDGAIAYIGQSGDLRKRLLNHQIRYGYSTYIVTPWGYAKVVELKYRVSERYGDWAMLELRLIKRLQPYGNRLGSRLKRGQAA